MVRAARVLVVDDDEDCQIIFGMALREAGLEVIAARDGEEALRATEVTHPDLILLDIAMPYLDGRDVVQRLRADAATHSVPVIAISANVTVDLYALGFDRVLAKPIHPSVVVTTVQQALTPASDQAAEMDADPDTAAE